MEWTCAILSLNFEWRMGVDHYVFEIPKFLLKWLRDCCIWSYIPSKNVQSTRGWSLGRSKWKLEDDACAKTKNALLNSNIALRDAKPIGSIFRLSPNMVRNRGNILDETIFISAPLIIQNFVRLLTAMRNQRFQARQHRPYFLNL